MGEGGDVDSYTCPGRPGTAQPDNDVMSGYSVSEVCLATETVVITPADLTTGPGGLDFIIGHEIGHRVGQVEKQLDNWDNSRSNQGLASEQSATCYAGMEIKADSPSAIEKVSRSLRVDTAVDPIHGSGDQQADAFIQGTQATDLGACSVEHFLGK